MKIISILAAAVLIFASCSPQSSRGWKESDVDEVAARAEAVVLQAHQTLWEYRVANGTADTIRDPRHTGVIGIATSPITTTDGSDSAKQLVTQPGWAKWLVYRLMLGNIKPRDKVAVSMTGSFPGLNIAVLAALQELEADVVCISSVGASNYGANEPAMTWLDMERILREKGVLKIGSAAVSLGGASDGGKDWDSTGHNIARNAIQRSGLPFLFTQGMQDAVLQRISIYGTPADYAVYISVGRSAASLGGGRGRDNYKTGGWYYDPAATSTNLPGMADFFQAAGINCLIMIQIEQMNKTFQIVTPPKPAIEEQP